MSPNAFVGLILDERYRVDSFVGEEEDGALVYRGQDGTTGAAVRVRSPGVPKGLKGIAFEQAIDTFLREAAILERASAVSDDVEHILAFGIAAEPGVLRRPFAIFEWLEGESLADYTLQRGVARSSLAEAIAILEPAARALAAIHANGLWHGDVRPHHLWLARQSGRVRMKLTEFVLASRLGGSEKAFAPEYGAPEHFNRAYGDVGPASDVYGLALCLLELLAGRPALASKGSELYLETSHLARRPTPRSLDIDVPVAVENVLVRAVAVDPKRRWQNANDFWEALGTALPDPARAAATRLPSVVETPASAPRRVHRLALVSWILAALFAVLVAAFALFRR